MLTVEHAAARRIVRLPDGRTARLIAVPASSQRRSKGAKARVQLQSGKVLSVEPGSLVLCDEG